jgi:hypothetical protein
MTPALLQRLLGLAAVALLAGLVAVAVVREEDEASNAAVPTPAPAFEGEDGWYVARAGSRGVARDAERTTCGTLLTDRSLGVAHPVLPCGAKIFLDYGGKTVLTTVVDRGPLAPGYQFELTPALADQVGLTGVQKIRWSFARAAGPPG